MNDLSELLERVKAATGPDRDLDGAIEVQARRFEAYRVGLNDATRARWKHSGGDVYDGHTVYYSAEVTASIDAALALVERVHPWGPWLDIKGCEKRKDGSSGPLWIVVMDGAAECRAKTLPLAILSALLQALGEKP